MSSWRFRRRSVRVRATAVQFSRAATPEWNRCTSGGDRIKESPHGGAMRRILTHQDMEEPFRAPSAILYKHSPT